jgi:hypothetical protein
MSGDSEQLFPGPGEISQLGGNQQRPVTSTAVDEGTLSSEAPGGETTEQRQSVDQAVADRRLVDLTGQLANFTAGLFYATVVLAIATVGLLLATIGLLRMALKSAEAYAAAERARLTRIDFSATKLTDPETEKVESFIFRLHWTNTGRTEAIKSITWCEHRICNEGEPVPTFDRPEGVVRLNRGIVGPGNTVHGPQQIVQVADLEAVARGEKAIAIYGRCEYSDILDPAFRQVTETCHAIWIDGEISELTRPFKTDPERVAFRYSAVGQQNNIALRPTPRWRWWWKGSGQRRSVEAGGSKDSILSQGGGS